MLSIISSGVAASLPHEGSQRKYAVLSDIDSPSPIVKVGDLGNSEFLQSIC